MVRTLFAGLVVVGLAFLAFPAQSDRAEAPAPVAKVAVERVESVGVTVRDMERSVEFYTKILTFEKVSDVEVAGGDYERLEGVFGVRLRVVRLKLGNELLDLTEYLAPRGRPIPDDAHSNDRSFQHVAIIVRDMDEAYKRLRQHRVQYASSGPQRLPDWNKEAAGIRAFYFRDPDGHFLEILQFPRDKGNPRWHEKTERLFLGIDHTAIVVADTEASLRFYRDLLGFKVAGESVNYGTEQEHLNNVFGARLRITSMRVAKGPGVEFLEYLAPGDGRPMPRDTRCNDLWNWQIRVQPTEADGPNMLVRGGRAQLVSPGVIALPEKELGFGKGLVVRDPDGHALLFTEK